MSEVTGAGPTAAGSSASVTQQFGYIEVAKDGAVVPFSGIGDRIKDVLNLGERRITGRRGARHFFTRHVLVYPSYSDIPGTPERVWLVRGLGKPSQSRVQYLGSPVMYPVVETICEASADMTRPEECRTQVRQNDAVLTPQLPWRRVEVDALRRLKYAITVLQGAFLGVLVWSLNVDDELRYHLSRVLAAYNGVDIESDGEWIRRSAETVLWAPYVSYFATALGIAWLLRKRCRILLIAQPNDELAIRADYKMAMTVTIAVGTVVPSVYWPDNPAWTSYWSPALLIGIGALAAFFSSWASAHWGYQAPAKLARGGHCGNVDTD